MDFARVYCIALVCDPAPPQASGRLPLPHLPDSSVSVAAPFPPFASENVFYYY